MRTKQECPYNRSAWLREQFGMSPSLTFLQMVERWKLAARERKWRPSTDLFNKIKSDLAKKAAKPNITIVHGKPPSTTGNQPVETHTTWTVFTPPDKKAKEGLEARVDALHNEYVKLQSAEGMLDSIYVAFNGTHKDIREAVLAARRVVGKHLVPKG